MRFHIFKKSSSQHLLIGDSQLKNLTFPNFNILSLPGAGIADVLNFLPRKNEYDIIALFIGANDLFTKDKKDSTRTPEDVAEELSQLGLRLTERCNKVFIIALPPRLGRPARTERVNDILRKKKQLWRYRGISKGITTKTVLSSDEVHLTTASLAILQTILKKKIIYKKFCVKTDSEGYLNIYHCGNNTCRCHHFHRD